MRIWEFKHPSDYDYNERGGYRMRDDYNMRDDEYERGFSEGCEHGYRKAMEHIYGDKEEYAERTIHHRGSSDNYGYGMRYPMPDTEMGMRRRRDSYGRFM